MTSALLYTVPCGLVVSISLSGKVSWGSRIQLRKLPGLASFLASCSAPLPLCPEDIPQDISVYFGYRKRTVEATTATLFLDLPGVTFELCCSQSSSTYQMGETRGQLYKLLFSFFWIHHSPCFSVAVGEKAETKQFCKIRRRGIDMALEAWKWTRLGGFTTTARTRGVKVCDSGDF